MRSYCCQTLFVSTNFIARYQTSPWHLAWHYPAQHWTNLLAPVKELRMFCRFFRTSPCPIIWLFARTLFWQVCETIAECLMVVRKVNQKNKTKPHKEQALFWARIGEFRCIKRERERKKKCEKGDRETVTLVIFDLLCYFHLFDILEYNAFLGG